MQCGRLPRALVGRVSVRGAAAAGQVGGCRWVSGEGEGTHLGEGVRITHYRLCLAADVKAGSRLVRGQVATVKAAFKWQ